jgi:ribosomal protein L14
MKERNEKRDTRIRKARKREAKNKNWNKIRRVSRK